MTTYNTSDFKKGLKIQIDGVPYLMVEMNFRKPGKGTALYECRMKNLIRGTMLDRTYRAGQTLEGADISEFEAQFLYRQGESFVFMTTGDYEQYELTAEQVGDTWKFLEGRHALHADGLGQQADRRDAAEPRDSQGRIRRADRPRQHGHQRAEAGQARNGRRDRRAGVRQHRRLPPHRHPHRRVHRTGQSAGSKRDSTVSTYSLTNLLTYSLFSHGAKP